MVLDLTLPRRSQLLQQWLLIAGATVGDGWREGRVVWQPAPLWAPLPWGGKEQQHSALPPIPTSAWISIKEKPPPQKNNPRGWIKPEARVKCIHSNSCTAAADWEAPGSSQLRLPCEQHRPQCLYRMAKNETVPPKPCSTCAGSQIPSLPPGAAHSIPSTKCCGSAASRASMSET